MLLSFFGSLHQVTYLTVHIRNKLHLFWSSLSLHSTFLPYRHGKQAYLIYCTSKKKALFTNCSFVVTLQRANAVAPYFQHHCLLHISVSHLIKVCTLLFRQHAIAHLTDYNKYKYNFSKHLETKKIWVTCFPAIFAWLRWCRTKLEISTSCACILN